MEEENWYRLPKLSLHNKKRKNKEASPRRTIDDSEFIKLCELGPQPESAGSP
jgi:hypothetical protein